MRTEVIKAEIKSLNVIIERYRENVEYGSNVTRGCIQNKIEKLESELNNFE